MSADPSNADVFFLAAPMTDGSAAPQVAKGRVATTPEDQVNRLSALGALIRQKMEATGIKKWEVTLDGTLQVGTGIIPGVNTGFKATIRFSSE
jgi:hypothetical protein